MYAFDVRDRPIGAADTGDDAHEVEVAQDEHPSELELLVRLCSHGPMAPPVWQSARRGPAARRPVSP